MSPADTTRASPPATAGQRADQAVRAAEAVASRPASQFELDRRRREWQALLAQAIGDSGGSWTWAPPTGNGRALTDNIRALIEEALAVGWSPRAEPHPSITLQHLATLRQDGRDVLVIETEGNHALWVRVDDQRWRAPVDPVVIEQARAAFRGSL